MNELNFWGFLSVSIITATVHALLPNHWFPFVAAARAYGWQMKQLLRFTALVGLAHAAVMVGLGALVGLLGEGVTHFFHDQAPKVVGIVLLGLAGLFLFAPRFYGHKHIHHPECEHACDKGEAVTLVGLFIALTFSPCEGLLPIFFAAAARLGWAKALGIIALSSLFTVTFVVGLVLLSYKGWSLGFTRLKESHERYLVSGLLAALSVFLLMGQGHH